MHCWIGADWCVARLVPALSSTLGPSDGHPFMCWYGVDAPTSSYCQPEKGSVKRPHCSLDRGN